MMSTLFQLFGGGVRQHAVCAKARTAHESAHSAHTRARKKSNLRVCEAHARLYIRIATPERAQRAIRSYTCSIVTIKHEHATINKILEDSPRVLTRDRFIAPCTPLVAMPQVAQPLEDTPPMAELPQRLLGAGARCLFAKTIFLATRVLLGLT